MPRKLFGFSILLLLLFFVSAATASGITYSMAGFDGEDSDHDWETNQFFIRMQDLTGISFVFDQYTNADEWQAAKDAMFESNDLPDVLFKAALTTEEQITYSDSGQLIDLLPLLPEYAPNLWALLQENPEWLAAITLPDGTIVALPTINEMTLQNAMWINQTWLDTLGLAMPTDAESLEAVLLAFLTEDPNQNGQQDEIPLSFLGPWDLKFLSHAFGLVANDYNVFVDESGTVQFLATQNNFIPFIEWLSSMYDQGLLDESGFTTVDLLRIVTDEDADATYGMFFGPNPYTLLPVEIGEQYVMLDPLVYNDEQVYRDIFGPITTGTFAITSACENPEELLAWVDVLYSQEGAIMALAGNEGTDYVLQDDGTWEYAADLDTDSSYVLYDLTIYDTGDMPWIFPVDFYASFSMYSLQLSTAELLELSDYLVSPFPYYYVLTTDEADYVQSIQLNLATFIDESIARFVTGEWDIHSSDTVAEFYEGLTENGMDDMVTFWQNIYNLQLVE